MNSDFSDRIRVPQINKQLANKPQIRNLATSLPKKKFTPKQIAITALATLLATGAIHFSTTNYNQNNNKENSRNIQKEIQVATLEQFEHYKDFEPTWNGTEFSISVPCSNSELYNVLLDSDLDELLNSYFAEPTKENKQILLQKLSGREEEFSKFNMDLVRASFADSAGTKLENVDIDVTFSHDNAEERGEIADGTEPYKGHTLKLIISDKEKEIFETAESYCKNGNTDYTQIDNELSALITSARLFEEGAENSTYFSNNEKENKTTLERMIEDIYLPIKKIINECNLRLKYNKVVLQNNANTYDYSIDLFGNPSIKEDR